jgi:hypothetical protein
MRWRRRLCPRLPARHRLRGDAHLRNDAAARVGPDEAMRQRVLVDNPPELYGF